MTPAISGLASGIYIATITDNKGCIIKDTTIITQPLHLNSIISKTDVGCYNANNGTATVAVNGGVSPYTYSWNTSPKQTLQTAIGLSFGQYVVTITDSNNCTIHDTVDIQQPTPLIGTLSKTDVNCFSGNNGTATIIVAGGTLPYTYLWNTVPAQTSSTATTLTAGIYTVLTTDQYGCTRLDSIIVTQPLRLTTSTSHTDVSCFNGNNGTATVVANGGTLPYTYLWNTSPQQTSASASNLTAGSKTVLVTDAKGCIKTDTVIIAQPTPITSGIIATNVNCFGGNNGTATLSVAGGTPPYSYVWNTNPPRTTNIATGLSAGTYAVTITDSKGCLKTDTTTITQPDLLTTTKSKTDVSCFGGNNGTATTVTSGGTTPYSYSWNTSPIQTTSTATGLTTNTYIVRTTDAKGCMVYDTIFISQPTQLVNAKSL
jgi:predicted heme/steroid binding protein